MNQAPVAFGAALVVSSRSPVFSFNILYFSIREQKKLQAVDTKALFLSE